MNAPLDGPAARLGRLWRTVRWLRAEQVIGRVRLYLPRPGPVLSPAPARRPATGAWAMPARRAASLLGPRRLRLLNDTQDLDTIGWDAPAIALLWRYNQHYFDDLNAHDGAQRHGWHVALLEDWLRANPPGRGTGWAPYPTSLRIVNWIKWWLGGAAAAPALLDSLAVQARWLAGRLETHLLGNHLFANAKALVFAGLCFEGAEAQAWQQRGWQLLDRELPKQILADGAQFERSPMYHALALEDVLDLLNLLTALAPAEPDSAARARRLRDLAASMLRWLRCLQHPDGTLARFNDSTEGVAPAAAEIERYAAALGVRSPALPTQGLELLQPSGYLRAARGPMLAWLDLAPIGPDYLPGHAHADTLSFELSLHGRAVVVNRGTSVYGVGERRQVERGTAMHSTVQVDGLDSSEVWAGFRVGRRARPSLVQVDGWQVEGSHDGYAYLAGRPRHHRRWHFEAEGLLIEDRVEPAAGHAAVARLHLAPGLALHAAGDMRWWVSDGAATVAHIDALAGWAEAGTTWHARGFGDLVEAATLHLHLVEGRGTVRLSWNP